MKIIVLGAGGMAGHIVALHLLELGYDITGLAKRELSFVKTIVADIHALDAVDFKKYDMVINCIGALTKFCNDNPAEGIWLNAYLPHLLAERANRVIHLSTDCIFSGHHNGNYKENALPTATDYYGRSKSLGELNDNKNLTFRMSIVGPDINENGIGLFNWFIKQRGTINGFTNAIWTGVTTITLANAIDAAIKQNLTGLYHLVNNETINKFELLKLFNNLRKEPLEIVPTSDYSADKSLVNTRTDFNFVVPSYADMTDEMAEWLIRHKVLYSHYT